MKYIVTLNNKQYEVEVEKGHATAVLKGEVPAPAAAPVPVAAAAAAPAPAPAPAAAPAATGGTAVSSPMPGTILEVRCAAGDVVKKGAILFILEAMKMENEIVAPNDGTVAAIHVSKGTTVETGTALCTLS